MPGFHMSVMKIPLRNTTEVIKLAVFDSTDVWHPVPADQCEEDDDAGLERAVEEVCKVILVRTGGKGLHVLPPCNISSVMAAVQRVVGAALLYTWGGKQKNEATEAEVEEWVRR